MSITHASGVRDDLADLVADAVDVGGGTAVLQIRDGTTLLVSFNLANPAFGAASSAVCTLNSTPIATTAVAAGDADNFRILDRAGSVVLSGSVTATGMGGDIEVSNTSIANGQDASLDSLTYESAP